MKMQKTQKSLQAFYDKQQSETLSTVNSKQPQEPSAYDKQKVPSEITEVLQEVADYYDVEAEAIYNNYLEYCFELDKPYPHSAILTGRTSREYCRCEQLELNTPETRNICGDILRLTPSTAPAQTAIIGTNY